MSEGIRIGRMVYVYRVTDGHLLPMRASINMEVRAEIVVDVTGGHLLPMKADVK